MKRLINAIFGVRPGGVIYSEPDIIRMRLADIAHERDVLGREADTLRARLTYLDRHPLRNRMQSEVRR